MQGGVVGATRKGVDGVLKQACFVVSLIVAEKFGIYTLNIKVVGSTRRNLGGVNAVKIGLVKERARGIDVVQHRVARQPGGGGQLGL